MKSYIASVLIATASIVGANEQTAIVGCIYNDATFSAGSRIHENLNEELTCRRVCGKYVWHSETDQKWLEQLLEPSHSNMQQYCSKKALHVIFQDGEVQNPEK